MNIEQLEATWGLMMAMPSPSYKVPAANGKKLFTTHENGSCMAWHKRFSALNLKHMA